MKAHLNHSFFALSLLLFFFIWEMISIFINSFIFPGPFEVAYTLIFLFGTGEIIPHIGASLKRTLVGFILGLSLGSIIGFSLGINKTLEKMVTPIIEILRPIPPIAWIPLAILWFGIGDYPAFFIIFIASFFPIFTNVFFGAKSIPLILKRVGENYQLNWVQKFEHITFPFTFPYLLAGSKTSIGFSWMVVVAAEMISANQGLGYFIQINRVMLRPEKVIAIMLLIGVIGYILHKTIIVVEKKYVLWRNAEND